MMRYLVGSSLGGALVGQAEEGTAQTGLQDVAPLAAPGSKEEEKEKREEKVGIRMLEDQTEV